MKKAIDSILDELIRDFKEGILRKRYHKKQQEFEKLQKSGRFLKKMFEKGFAMKLAQIAKDLQNVA